MSEPIPTTVKRWKCPHCNRHHSRRPAASEHIARCWSNPDNQTCWTCAHHAKAYTAPASAWCFPGRHCDCNDMDEHCMRDDGPEPESFPVVNCPLWELAVTS